MRAAGSALLALLLVAQLASALRVPLLAVTPGGEGVVVWAELDFGGDVVRVEPEGLVGADTRLSLELASMMAALLAGGEPGVRAVFGDGEVSGASAGAVFAAVALLARRGLAPPEPATGTGMLSPLGLVLPVQGVEAKLEAALAEGVRRVFVPAPFNGSAPAGLRLARVCTVFEAAASMIGEPMRGGAALPPAPPAADKLFADDAELLLSLALRLGLNASRAVEAYELGRYYVAASLAYSQLASQHQRALAPVLEVLNASDVRGALDGAATRLYRAYAEARHRGAVPLGQLAAILAAASRLYVAERLAMNSTALGLAALRALTVHSWLDVAEEVDEGPLLPPALVDEAARVVVRYASLSLEYAVAVAGRAAAEIVMEDGRSVAEWLDDARQYLVSGNPIKAMALAIRVLAELDAALALASMGPRAASECYERLVAEYVQALRALGVEPGLPMLYHHYAEALGHPYSAALEASAASRLLLYLLLLNKLSGAQPTAVASAGSALPYALAAATLAAAVAAACFAAASAASRKEVEYGLRP